MCEKRLTSPAGGKGHEREGPHQGLNWLRVTELLVWLCVSAPLISYPMQTMSQNLLMLFPAMS